MILWGFGMTDWTAFNNAHRLLDASPTLQDSLYRAAASAPDLPGLGQTILLAYLNEPKETDRAWLRELWSRALESGQILQIDFSEAARYGTVDGLQPCNIDATAIIYTFNRWDDKEGLRHLLRTCPNDAPDLRRSIAAFLDR